MGRGRLAVLLLAAGSLSNAAACNDETSGGPTGKGNELKVDVDATVQPAQPPPDLEGGGYGSLDGYAPLAWCNQCACEGGTFCFGGATAYTTFDGKCDNAATGAALAIGCNLPPSGCVASDCICLIQALSPPDASCNAICVGTSTPAVYCPNP